MSAMNDVYRVVLGCLFILAGIVWLAVCCWIGIDVIRAGR